MIDSTKRFSSRVENYIKYRPGYPPNVLDLFKEKCGLTTASVIADIGSGTGILTELFLRNGNPVFAVEPNREMRGAAERLLGKYPNFTSISGTAEATTLKEQNVNFITASQAFHWFNREWARREFLRILKPGGWVALIWNDRELASPFARAYERLLKTYGTDYEDVNHKHSDAKVLGPFFGASGYVQANFPNRQLFDLEGLKGRLLSSSYAPEAGHLKHAPMLEALNALFSEHQNRQRPHNVRTSNQLLTLSNPPIHEKLWVMQRALWRFSSGGSSSQKRQMAAAVQNLAAFRSVYATS